MSSEVQLRIRYPDGASHVNNFSEHSTIAELKKQILSVVKAKPEYLVLRVGYPPTPLNLPDATNLADAQMTSGDTIIVEIHQEEEPQIESKPNVSENFQNQSKPIASSDVRAQARPPTASNQPSHGASNRLVPEEFLLDSDEEFFEFQQVRQSASNQPQTAVSKGNTKQSSSNQRNVTNPSTGLMGSDVHSYQNKISSASNANYKNGGGAYGNSAADRKTTSVPGNIHGATNLSKGRSKEFVARKPHEFPTIVDLTGEEIEDPRIDKKVKHDVNDDGGRMMFGRQMTPEEYDEEYARLLQESFENPSAEKLLKQLEQEKKMVVEAQRNASHPQTKSAGSSKIEQKRAPPLPKTNDRSSAQGRLGNIGAMGAAYRGPGRQVRFSEERIPQRYDSSQEFYDITQQFAEENNLPIDPPKKNKPVEDVYNPRTIEGGIQEDDDEMLQRALQESLMQSKKQ